MRSRYPRILELAEGKSVLDIGCLADGTGYTRLWDLLHTVTDDVIGLDVRESDRPDILQGSVETFHIERQFDLIVFGSTLEHVSNQGLALDNLARHLKPDGRMVVTVPNCKTWSVVFRPHFEHVLWHDRYTLTVLLNRHGFEVTELFNYYGSNDRMSALFRFLYRNREILAVCRKKPE